MNFCFLRQRTKLGRERQTMQKSEPPEAFLQAQGAVIGTKGRNV